MPGVSNGGRKPPTMEDRIRMANASAMLGGSGAHYFTVSDEEFWEFVESEARFVMWLYGGFAALGSLLFIAFPVICWVSGS